MRLVMDLVQRAAAGRCGILICGERGSGREMIARAIHSHDPNPYAPFVKVDCSGPTPEDIELQLFGSVIRQAGARHGSAGQSGAGHVERRSLERIASTCRLREADGGILFLENVMDLPARAQARLVRVLRDREAFVGEGRETHLDRHPADRVGGRVGRSGARGRPPRARSLRAPLTDSRGRARAAPAARGHSGAGDAFPEGTVQGQRQADQDAHPSGARRCWPRCRGAATPRSCEACSNG